MSAQTETAPALDPKAAVRRLIDEVMNAGRLELIAEGEKVVGRFRCSATNLGAWRERQLGRSPRG